MKKIFAPLVLLLMVLTGTIRCRSGVCTGLEEYTLPLYTPEYASGFAILGAEGRQSTLLKISNPWQGAKGVDTYLLIARNGESVPENFPGQVLRGNAQRIVCMSSSHIAMLDAIGAVETVVGVSGSQFVTHPYIAAHRDRIGDVGYDGNINFELLLSLEPDIVLLYGVNGISTMETKLRELGIPFAYIGEYVEEIPLGKTEWMIALAELVGERDKGIAAFTPIPIRYQQLSQRALAARSARPKVMINTPYADSWFMPSTSSYIARLIEDAGGDYLYRNNTDNASKAIDLEEAALLISEADIWIHVEGCTSLAALKQRFPKFADMDCVRQGKIYNCDKRRVPGGGNDYWESGVIHPDQVLGDLVKIFHPELMEDWEFIYYRKLE